MLYDYLITLDMLNCYLFNLDIKLLLLISTSDYKLCPPPPHERGNRRLIAPPPLPPKLVPGAEIGSTEMAPLESIRAKIWDSQFKKKLPLYSVVIHGDSATEFLFYCIILRGGKKHPSKNLGFTI